MKKTVLIIILVVLILGVGTAAYFMMNPPIEDLTAYEGIGDFDGNAAEPVTNEAILESIKEALRKEYEKELDDYEKVFQHSVLNDKIFKVTSTDREGFDTSYYLALLKYQNEKQEEIYDTAIIDETFRYLDRIDGLYNTYSNLYIKMNQNKILKMQSLPPRSPATYLSMVQFTGKKFVYKSTKDLDPVLELISEKQKYLDKEDIEYLANFILGSHNLNFSYHEEAYLTQLTEILDLGDRKAKEAVAAGDYDKATDYYAGTLDDIYSYFGVEDVLSLTSEVLDDIEQNSYLPSKEYYVNALYSYADAMSHVEDKKHTGEKLFALLQQIAPR